MKETEPENANDEFMDQQGVTHSFAADENHPESLLHISKQGEFLRRTDVRGRDVKILGQMAIVFQYESWDHTYRKKFERALDMKLGEELMSDLFGDLRRLRNAILHNRGLADDKVAEAKILRWFREGDEIFIPRERANFSLRRSVFI